MKYFSINLTRHTKDWNAESYKTLMKEATEELNKWRDIPHSWIGRLIIVKDGNSPPNLSIGLGILINQQDFQQIQTSLF